jgi:hypothetical protein
MPSTKTRISALLPTTLIIEIRNEAEERHSTQSAILEEALRLWFEKQLKEDAKVLSALKFNDLPSEDEWVGIQSSSF